MQRFLLPKSSLKWRMTGGECQETCSGPWHVNQNDPHYSSQDMKLPKISARWVPILSDEEMKKERVRCTRPTVVMIVVDF